MTRGVASLILSISLCVFIILCLPSYIGTARKDILLSVSGLVPHDSDRATSRADMALLFMDIGRCHCILNSPLWILLSAKFLDPIHLPTSSLPAVVNPVPAMRPTGATIIEHERSWYHPRVHAYK